MGNNCESRIPNGIVANDPDVSFHVSNGQVESSFCIATFCCEPAVGGLEPKGSSDSMSYGNRKMAIYMGLTEYVLTVFPFAPPTHD